MFVILNRHLSSPGGVVLGAVCIALPWRCSSRALTDVTSAGGTRNLASDRWRCGLIGMYGYYEE